MLAQGWSAQDGRMGPKRTVPVHPSVVLPGTRSPGAEAKVVDLAVWEKERLERRRAEPDKGSGDRSLLPDLRGVGSESDHPTRYGCDPITVLAEEHRAQVLKLLAENVVNKAHVGQGTVAVDLGCGNGQLALALARNGVKVIASDNRSVTVELLEARAALAKLCNVAGVACELTELDFEADSIDLVVSSNALHGLRKREREALVHAVARWLRPGGQFVIGDVVGVPERSTDSGAPTTSNVAGRAGAIPDGSRLAKATGWSARRQRGRPVTAETWLALLGCAGFVDLSSVPLPFCTAVMSGAMPPRLRAWVPQGPL